MSSPVVAIGLDAANPQLLEKWMDQGLLPNLARFRSEGTFGIVNNVRYYRTETSWITFLTGALPGQTGEWGHVQYDPARYAAEERSAYAFRKYPPFYAQMPEKRVAVFDPPLARLTDGVNGLQVLGWGTEANQCLRTSQPRSLIAELVARHGAHPMFEDSAPEVDDSGEEVYSYRIPSSYDMAAIERLRDRLVAGAARRAAMMQDLLAREAWDLFLGVFSETHTASHLLWHVSQQHPLRDTLMHGRTDDPLLEVFQAVDRALGEVLKQVPDNTDVVLFSIYGIAENVLDLPSMAFLPELLYRWSFPGQEMLGATGARGAAPDYTAHWKNEIWKLRTARGDAELESPAEQERQGDPMHWQPANWYRLLWPRMKAFALPTYSEGLIRINVQGRERDGQVAAADYKRTCDEICDLLASVRDAHSGKPMVKEVIRVRSDPFDRDSLGPPADLIVLWQEDAATDMIEIPSAGRIGPLPYFRTGGHCSQGFLAARGPRVVPGSRLTELQATDLTATLLSLLGQPVPDHMHGQAVL